MSRTATGSLLLLTAIGFWGGSFWGTEIAARHSPAGMLSGVRCAVALALLLVLLPLVRSRLPDRRLWLWTAVTGVLMVVLFLEGLAEGTSRAGAANASVLTNTPPLFVLVLSWIFLRERASRASILGLVAGFAGVVVMVAPQLGGDRDTGDLVVGLVWALVAALGFAVGSLIVAWLLRRDPGINMFGLIAGQYLVASPILLAIGFATSSTSETNWSSGELWGSLAYLAIGPSVLATVAFLMSFRHVSVTTASAWLFLTPVIAVLIEIARGNTPRAIVGVGMALTILGVALVTAAPTLAARREAPAVGGSDVAT